MTITTALLTLEEYLDRDHESEKHYELVAGSLTEMPPESPQNAEIAIKILIYKTIKPCRNRIMIRPYIK